MTVEVSLSRRIGFLVDDAGAGDDEASRVMQAPSGTA